MGDGGSGTLNRVGMALGFSFFPPAGDLAISSNWLSSKWSCEEIIWNASFARERTNDKPPYFVNLQMDNRNKHYRHYVIAQRCLGAQVYKLAWHNLEQGVGTKSRRQFITHFLLRTGSFGNLKSCLPIVVELEQFGAEHPPIFFFIKCRKLAIS